VVELANLLVMTCMGVEEGRKDRPQQKKVVVVPKVFISMLCDISYLKYVINSFFNLINFDPYVLLVCLFIFHCIVVDGSRWQERWQ